MPVDDDTLCGLHVVWSDGLRLAQIVEGLLAGIQSLLGILLGSCDSDQEPPTEQALKPGKGKVGVVG